MKRNYFQLKFQNKKTILALLCLRGRFVYLCAQYEF